MTPNELKQLLKLAPFELSQIAFTIEVPRHKVASYLDGDLGALSEEEVKRLDENYDLTASKKDTNLATYDHLTTALSKFIGRHSVQLLYEDGGRFEGGSGTLVRLGERLFVCTCSHAIPRRTDFFVLLGDNEPEITLDKVTGKFKADSVEIINHGRNRDIDIGFLEVRPIVLQSIGRDAIGLENLSVKPMQPGRMATFLGYPKAIQQKEQLTARIEEIRFGSFTYPGSVLHIDEWPSVPDGAREPDPSIDVFLRYKQEVIQTRVSTNRKGERTVTNDTLPDVDGMSGGGLWQSWQPAATVSLLFPEHQELFAIQHHWYPPGSYVRATQIRHLLELVAENYEDLKPIINDHLDDEHTDQPQ